ncbi:hypothetical protein A7U60_g5044 [Sanghuangporus baumii]|uniref:Uncharacterized protein n=1 Tax=Sanghuangporus baumii TaxID=108892 RepID=A0A9Q5HY75_SANBA|nr:hypothetical protein A7U60_g5044 [Sanghuangporus baumii]
MTSTSTRLTRTRYVSSAAIPSLLPGGCSEGSSCITAKFAKPKERSCVSRPRALLAYVEPATPDLHRRVFVIAGFTQARSPHVTLIIPTDAKSRRLVHIRIDRATSLTWAYRCTMEKVEGNMFLSSLLKIHDASEAELTVAQLEAVAKIVHVLKNSDFGECDPWVFTVTLRSCISWDWWRWWTGKCSVRSLSRSLGKIVGGGLQPQCVELGPQILYNLLLVK